MVKLPTVPNLWSKMIHEICCRSLKLFMTSKLKLAKGLVDLLNRLNTVIGHHHPRERVQSSRKIIAETDKVILEVSDRLTENSVTSGIQSIHDQSLIVKSVKLQLDQT